MKSPCQVPNLRKLKFCLNIVIGLDWRPTPFCFEYLIRIPIPLLDTPQLMDIPVLSAITTRPVDFDTKFLRSAFGRFVEGVDTADIASGFRRHLNGIEFLEASPRSTRL